MSLKGIAVALSALSMSGMLVACSDDSASLRGVAAPPPSATVMPESPVDAAPGMAPPQRNGESSSRKPKTRPGPSDEQGRAAAQGDYRRQEFLDLANAEFAVGHPDGLRIGQVKGPQFVVLGWGDVLNFQAAQTLAIDDQVIVRVIRREGSGPNRNLYVVAIDPKRMVVLDNVAISGDVGTDNYDDLPGTPWRD